MDCTPCQQCVQNEGLVAVSKVLAGLGHLRIHFAWQAQLASAVQEAHESDFLGGQGADFLLEISFDLDFVLDCHSVNVVYCSRCFIVFHL